MQITDETGANTKLNETVDQFDIPNLDINIGSTTPSMF